MPLGLVLIPKQNKLNKHFSATFKKIPTVYRKKIKDITDIVNVDMVFLYIFSNLAETR